ncbi:DnaJ domain-containing protein [Syncephalis plumigaleata]|nr:DnaJ domain-containing protein [Syncephalis plumigaleata]
MNIDEILKEFKREPDLYDDLYGILGCAPISTPQQIATEYRQRVLACHPDRNPPNIDAARQEFERLSIAYEILSDEGERAKYDRWRGSGLAISFARWRTMSEQSQSVHWRQTSTQPTLDNKAHEDIAVKSSSNSNSRPITSVSSESDRLLEQFRRYEI